MWVAPTTCIPLFTKDYLPRVVGIFSLQWAKGYENNVPKLFKFKGEKKNK